MSTVKMPACSFSAAVRPSMSARGKAVVVRAQATQNQVVDRRAALGLFAAAVGAALVAPKDAAAMGLPWQETTGGLGKGKGSLPKSSTTATSEGYSLEGFPGTRKPSYVEPKKRKALMAKARASAEQVAKI